MSEYVQAEVSLGESVHAMAYEALDILRGIRDRLPERPEPSPAPEGDEGKCPKCGDDPSVAFCDQCPDSSDEIERLTAERDEARDVADIEKRRGDNCFARAEKALGEDIDHLQHAWDAAGSRGEGYATLSAFIKRTLEKMDGYRISLAATERALAAAQAADGEAASLLRELDAAKEERDDAEKRSEAWAQACAAAEAREKDQTARADRAEFGMTVIRKIHGLEEWADSHERDITAAEGRE